MRPIFLFTTLLLSCYGDPGSKDRGDSVDETKAPDMPGFFDNDPGTDLNDLDSEGENVNVDTSPSPVTWTECDQWPGSHPCDFTLKDQNQADWNLYDHYGTVILIDFSTMWCTVCKNIASDIEDIQSRYVSAGHNFLWVTVLIEDAQRGDVDPGDVTAWVDEYGITSSIVLAGSRDMIDLSGEDGYPITSWPTLVVIDDEMILTNGLNGWNEGVVLGWVDDALGL